MIDSPGFEGLSYVLKSTSRGTLNIFENLRIEGPGKLKKNTFSGS